MVTPKMMAADGGVRMESHEWIAAMVTPKMISALEEAGIDMADLGDDEMGRLLKLLWEELQNSIPKAELAKRRLQGHAHAEKVEATKTIVESIAAVAAKRFIASMKPRHGPG